MRTDTEGLVHVLPTLRTCLRGAVSSNGNHLTTSTFSLVLKQLAEHSPGCISNRESQAMVPYHVRWLQIFNDESLIVFDIVMRSFMKGIFALVGHALVNTRHKMLGFLTTVTALLALRELTLRARQFLGAFLGMLGIVDDVPIAICHQRAYTHIKPNGIALLREWYRRCLTDTLEIPARGTQDNARTFERAFKGPMHNHTDTTATLSRSFEASIVQAVCRVTELDRIPCCRILEARKTNFTEDGPESSRLSSGR